MWPSSGNSAPERGAGTAGTRTREAQDLERVMSELLIASEERVFARMRGLERSLDQIKSSLQLPTGGGASSSPAAAEAEPHQPSSLTHGGISLPLPPPPPNGGEAEGLSATPPSGMRTSWQANVHAPAADAPSMRLVRMGTLTVHVKRAHDLIKADFAGLSDPYVVVKLPGFSARRTRTERKTLNPTWDEKIEYECVLEAVVGASVTLEVYDEDFGVSSLLGSRSKRRNYDKNNTDDKLGKVSAIKLAALATEDVLEHESVTLEAVKTGRISFAITWSEMNLSVEGDSQVRGGPEREPRATRAPPSHTRAPPPVLCVCVCVPFRSPGVESDGGRRGAAWRHRPHPAHPLPHPLPTRSPPGSFRIRHACLPMDHP